MQVNDPLLADVVMWEACQQPRGALTAEQVEQIMGRVRSGSSLLCTCQQFPGLAPVMLGSLLPTTGLASQLRLSPHTPLGPLAVEKADDTFFAAGIAGLIVAFCLDIRSASAAERGQACYERYGFTHSILKTHFDSNSDYWTRSLLNREWKVRARCDDLSQTPLVTTGRYGAGKVVMIATSAAGIGESPSGQQFWTSVLRWLLDNDQAPKSSVIPNVAVLPSQKSFTITLTNPSIETLHLQIVMRALTASGAIISDNLGELEKKASVPPRGCTTLKLPLPSPSAISDDAVSIGEPLNVRIGILSGNGQDLLFEQRLTSPQPVLRMQIRTDNLYGLAYPFHAPGPEALASFQARMGAFTGAYAYVPGSTVKGSIVLYNGIVNLAPLSIVEDITNPGNASVMALNDEATGMRAARPLDGIQGYSMWVGTQGVENVLSFTLPPGSQITAVIIVGNYGLYRNGEWVNPGAAIIEADSDRLAAIDNLDHAFEFGLGQARIGFQRRRAATVTIRFPWVEMIAGRKRLAPGIGEIRIEGWQRDPPQTTAGDLNLYLVDAIGGERTPVLAAKIRLDSGIVQNVPYAICLPQFTGIRFFRLEAEFAQMKADAPILGIAPTRPLLPLTDLVPAAHLSAGLIVSSGFREVFRTGTGTAEPFEGWASADDLIWAYSRQLKQIPAQARTEANRLYVTESDMRHYITPWRSFPNGELFFPTAAGDIVDNFRSNPRWSKETIAVLAFSDRWDTGPDLTTLHGWQDFVEFDKWLRVAGGPALQGRTRQQLAAEIHGKFEDQWQAWQLSRYLLNVRSLRDAFQAAGKTLLISAQGIPMVAGDPGRELALTIRGMNDDCTWGMIDNSPVLTTGRQLSEVAFNPVWQISTLLAWGFVSPIFNSWQWHAPVATPEPTRRLIYDRAWRATIWPGGSYASVYTYGYNSNVGIALTMTERDFQQWWYLQERHSLIAPEAPVGAGLVISSQKSADLQHIRFTCGDALAIGEARLLARAFRNLHNAGVSLPFCANAASLASWEGTAPLILLNLPDFIAQEVETLRRLHASGTRLAAFSTRSALSPAADDLFSQPGTLLIEQGADTLTHAEAMHVAATLQTALDVPLRFPEGTAGYGFRSQNKTFIVIEDWLEQARFVEVSMKKKSKLAKLPRACNVNNHRSLTVRDQGDFWLVDVPVRSGDGILISVEEG